MRIIKKIFVGLLILIVVLAVAVAVYLQLQKPVYEGKITLQGLKAQVEVLYDDYGVPHIYAQSEDDAYFALGYVHAQDRLFQMEMLRRASGGRLAEVLGEDLIPVDKMFRTLRLNKFAREHAQKFMNGDTADFQRAAHAYQKGVNTYVREGKTPLEFTIIGIPKQEFAPEDIYLAVGFMSFGFAEGIRADPVLEKIRSEWGDAYLADLAVQTPPEAVRIKSYPGTGKTLNDSLIVSLHNALERLPIPLWQGSNGWVIAGDRTASGFPILANDTHIGFGQPAVWYEAHLEYPGFSFYGHHIAGIPFGLLGNNEFAGWGLTMFENDETDFFVETTNPANANEVKFQDGWEPIQTREEIIKVKGKPDVKLEVKTTRHGNIMNGLFDVPEAGNPVALSWILTSQTNEALQAIYQFNHVSSFNDIQQAVARFSAPGLNVMYADRAGNIAWWAVAKLPIRPAHVQPKFFLDGSSGKDEYQGFYDFSKNPQAINPPWGYVYSANNQPDTVNGIFYPGYYFPRARAGRVEQLISENKKWTIEDVKKVNLDVVSIMHPQIAKEIAAILDELNTPAYSPLSEILRDWNGDHQTTDTGPSVFYNMLSQIMFIATKDELGESGSETLLATTIPKNSFYRFISNGASPWWDDQLTKDVKETRGQIVDRAAAATLKLLEEKCGKDPEEWQWSKIHSLTHNHALGVVKPLDKIFNVGPLTVPGGMEVINNLSFDLNVNGEFPVKMGPALRKITDFADVKNGITVSPTGQSGNVVSIYYDDQAEMFATGQFRKMMMDRKEIEQRSKVLKLIPHL